MIETKEKFFVLTGGPGSGKSTLLESLKALGLSCVAESGRRIIQTQRVIGGDALPWKNAAFYAEMELGTGLVAYCETDESRVTLFDRGIGDPLGFLTIMGLTIPAHMREAVRRFRYNQAIFIAPPWEEIYVRDTEREQSFAEARATYEAMLEVYGDAGYRLIPLPLDSVATRVTFILDTISTILGDNALRELQSASV